jgi:hypothetical protein
MKRYEDIWRAGDSQAFLSGSEALFLLFLRKLGKPLHANLGDLFGYFLNGAFSFSSHIFFNSRR